MTQYFVRFPANEMRLAARPMLDADTARFRAYFPQSDEQVLIADLSDRERKAAEKNGATVYDDIQFEPFPVANPLEYRGPNWAYWEAGRQAGPSPSSFLGLAELAAPALPPWQTKTLADVLDHIRAPQAWAKSRGAGVTIGIVDTGVSSVMPEFPAAKRSPYSTSFAYPTGPWEDVGGHGSMCACIATGTKSAGGRYDGVAPDATLMSLRTSLAATDIYKLYDWVLTHKRGGQITGPIVLSNSYGLYTCSAPPGLPEDHPYRDIILEAIGDGIMVVFAAGNNHYDVLCNHNPNQCKPNTIWAVNSLDEVLSVGTVNWDNKMNEGAHANSSRGPGQWASAHKKPDCVAPTYGEVIWGSHYQAMEWWGTSGACPQVAGLAALLLSADPNLKPAKVGNLIRASCKDIGLPAACAGAGLISCEEALNSLAPLKPTKPAGKESRREKPARARSKAGKK